MHPILGYIDRWSVKPGDTLKLMVSSAAGKPFTTRLARIQCGDPNPRGPGYRETAMAHKTDGSHAGQEQRIHLGSWGRLPLVDLGRGAVIVVATIWPTTPQRGRQVIASWRGGDGASLSLELDGDGIVARLESAHGTARIATGKRVLERSWYDIWLAFDPATRELSVGQVPREVHLFADDEGSATVSVSAVRMTGAGRAALAALLDPSPAGHPSCHYNGKLERPTIWSGLALSDAISRQKGQVPRSETPHLIACWDFSIGIPTLTVADVGPHGFHGMVENLPTRAMTGSNWSGDEHRWTARPEEWGAIHFHDDDLGDAGWTPSLEIRIPDNWPSGLYAIHLENERGFDNVPFVVRPAESAEKAKIAILLPTVTYHIYSQFVRPGFGARNRARAVAWGAITHTPDENPELGLSTYNDHSDGSGVSIATMARPMIDKRVNHFEMMDPAAYGSGCYWLNVDSYIIDWLTREGFAHDVICDHDLQAEGSTLLEPYTLVITCQHPEYYTTEMLDGLEGYLTQGGRLMYLGGNGFYWKTVFHKEAPYALEVRRAEGGIRKWATEVGESYHAFDGSYGGLWRRIGRPAHRLVGNGFSSQGSYLGFPYKVVEGIMHPRVSFLRDGLETELVPGVAMGERGLMGGGAVGHELDRADVRLGTPAHALVVAVGIVDHPDFKPVNEDRLDHQWPGTVEEVIRSDLTFFETPAGGAVLSAGSMNFVGALPIDDYKNLLTRMMTNAVRRFVDPKPFFPVNERAAKGQ